MARRPAQQQPETAQSGMDPNALIELISQGKTMEQAVALLQQKAIRENAVAGFGLATVRLAHGAKFKTKKKANYTIGSLVSIEGLKYSKNGNVRPMTEAQFDALRGIEVDLTATDGCIAQIETYRDTSGVTTGSEYELILAKPATFNKSLSVRFPAGHENEGEDVYIIDVNADHWDPSNWTADENQFPLLKMQIQLHVSGFLTATPSELPSQELPEDDAEELEFFKREASVSRKVQEIGLRSWQNAKAAEMNMASEASLQKEMEEVVTESAAQAV